MNAMIKKRCNIGEGPIWNARAQSLYFVNGWQREVCRYRFPHNALEVVANIEAAAIAFDTENRMILSTESGIFFWQKGILTPLYDTKKHSILYANDMKVGPDGRLYVGTQSGKRKGVSDQIDGKLYCIDAQGTVRVLLEHLSLSNGMDWSNDARFFYHTESDTHCIKEYDFDKETGQITQTGRQTDVHGVDGFCIDSADRILACCWGQGHLAVIDTHTMRVCDDIPTPFQNPTSCCFCDFDQKTLAVVSASYDTDLVSDPNAGYLFLQTRNIGGRMPYLFGGGTQ